MFGCSGGGVGYVDGWVVLGVWGGVGAGLFVLFFGMCVEGWGWGGSSFGPWEGGGGGGGGGGRSFSHGKGARGSTDGDLLRVAAACVVTLWMTARGSEMRRPFSSLMEVRDVCV